MSADTFDAADAPTLHEALRARGYPTRGTVADVPDALAEAAPMRRPGDVVELGGGAYRGGWAWLLERADGITVMSGHAREREVAIRQARGCGMVGGYPDGVFHVFGSCDLHDAGGVSIDRSRDTGEWDRGAIEATSETFFVGVSS